MPKKGRKGRKMGLGASTIERVHYNFSRGITTIVEGTAQTIVPVNSSSALMVPEQVIEMSDVFRFYRFVRLHVHIIGNPASESGLVGYCPGAQANPPTSFAQASSFPYVKVALADNTIQQTLKLNWNQLRSMTDWYQTETLGDAELDTQGNLVFSLGLTAAVASAMAVWFEGDVEFKDILPSAVTVERRAAREARRLAAGFAPPRGLVDKQPASATPLSAEEGGDRRKDAPRAAQSQEYILVRAPK